MRRSLVVLAVVVSACSGSGADTTISTLPETTTTSTTTTTLPESTTTVTLPPQCPEAPYDVGVLPPRAAVGRPPSTEQVVLDQFTTIPGISAKIWIDEEGAPVMALVRGSLPPEEWPGERGEVSIDGARGVAGQFEDGTWVVAWFEEPGARCDRYMLVVYQPVEAAQVEATVASLDRTAG